MVRERELTSSSLRRAAASAPAAVEGRRRQGEEGAAVGGTGRDAQELVAERAAPGVHALGPARAEGVHVDQQ